MPVTEYITTLQQANQVINQLLLQGNIPSQLGLDLEWKPTYVKGAPENPVSLLQLASKATAYLFHLSQIKAFPERLRYILENPYILKTGVGIQGDVKKLHKDWGVSVVSCVDLSLLARCIDSTLFAERLGRYANVGELQIPPAPPAVKTDASPAQSTRSVMVSHDQQLSQTTVTPQKESEPQPADTTLTLEAQPEPYDPYALRLFRGRYRDPIGLARFMRIFHDVELDKGKITRSNWERYPLSPSQIDYAAKDAHASYIIYNDLLDLLRLIPAEKMPKRTFFSFDCIAGQLYRPYKPEMRDILAISPESTPRIFTLQETDLYLRGIGDPRSATEGLVLWAIENPEYEPAHPPAKPKKEKEEDGDKDEKEMSKNKAKKEAKKAEHAAKRERERADNGGGTGEVAGPPARTGPTLGRLQLAGRLQMAAPNSNVPHRGGRPYRGGNRRRGRGDTGRTSTGSS
ncbi:werner syndrome atp-dependent helicase-like [Moniliophthora roreri]|uniref:3'-5' exonuclease n=1 Tax=Moniliophthora roreri TaxID=221103 RepID=A0A0W0FY54_MONRR|nr:werner syndrome atp-dependent helicase-like [Moniliophthora roreri]